MEDLEVPSRKEEAMTPDAREYLARELGEEWLEQHEFFFVHQMNKQRAMELAPWFRSLDRRSS